MTKQERQQDLKLAAWAARKGKERMAIAREDGEHETLPEGFHALEKKRGCVYDQSVLVGAVETGSLTVEQFQDILNREAKGF